MKEKIEVLNELKGLVKKYQHLEKSGKEELPDTIEGALAIDPELVDLEKDFTSLINLSLLNEGAETAAIQQNYRKLSRLFHSDVINRNADAVWIEDKLSQGQNNGACFKILDLCYKKLTEPKNFKKEIPPEYKKSHNRESFRDTLVRLKEQSKTFQSYIYLSSLIDLIDQTKEYYDETGKISNKGIRLVLRAIPVILVGAGALVLAEELLALYFLCYILLTGGNMMTQSELLKLRAVGYALHQVGYLSQITTTVILAHTLKWTLWLSKQCVSKSMGMFLTSAPSSSFQGSPEQEDKLSKDLARATSKKAASEDSSFTFKSSEFKSICAPIQSYLYVNKYQGFGMYRVGREKKKILNQFLFEAQLLEDELIPLENKLLTLGNRLADIKEMNVIYADTAKDAIDDAVEVVKFSSESFLKYEEEVPKALTFVD